MDRRLLRVLVVAAVLLLPLCSAEAQRRGKSPGTPAGKKDAAAVAIVNGTKIPYKRYKELYGDQISYQLKIGKGPEVAQEVDDQIFMQIVDNELMRQQAAKRGIVVTYDQARKTLLSDPPDFIKEPFTDASGTFQAETFRQVILNPNLIGQLVGPGMNRDSVIARWKADLDDVILFIQAEETKRRLKESLHKEKPLTPSKIKYRYFAEKTRFTGSFVRVLHSTVPDSLVPVTEAEAKAWYESHQEDYRFAAARRLAAMIIPVRPLPSDSALQRERIATVRDAVMSAPMAARSRKVGELQRALPPDRIPQEAISLVRLPRPIHDSLRHAKPGDIIGPFTIDGEDILYYVESTASSRDTVVRARHILLKIPPDDPNGDSATAALGKMLIEKIDGLDKFLQGVEFYSSDASVGRGGDLGFFSRGMMLKEFEDVAFAAPTGKAVGHIRTQFGYHLIWVDEKFTTDFKVRELRFPFAPGAEAREAVIRDAMQYASAVRAGTASDSLFFDLRGRYPGILTDTSVIRRLDIYGDGIAPANFAFSANPGDVAVLKLPFDRVMIAQLLNAWPSGVAPYEGIRHNYVIPHVQRAKQLELLAPTVDSLRSILTPEMMVGIMRLTAPMAESFMIQDQYLTSPPDEDTTLIDSLVWATPQNAVTGPVRGTHGYYFLRVMSKSAAPTEADFQRDRERYARDFGERYREKLLNDLMAKVRQYAEVEDLRPSAQVSPPSSQGRSPQ